MSETYNVIRYHCRLLPFSTFPVQRTEPLGLSFLYLPGIVFFFLKMDFELFACKKKNLCIPASTNVDLKYVCCTMTRLRLQDMHFRFFAYVAR